MHTLARPLNFLRAWRLLSRKQKTGIILGLLVLLYLTLGFFLVPPVTKSILVSRLSKNLNRTVSVDRISFNPLTLHIHIRNLKIMDSRNKDLFAGFQSLGLNLSLTAVFKPALGLDEISLKAPWLKISYLGQGRFDHSDLLHPEKEQSKDQDNESKGLFPFQIMDLDVADGTIIYEDTVLGLQHEITDIRLALPSISSLEDDQEEDVRPFLSFLVNGSPFALQGTSLPFHHSLRTSFRFVLQDMDLSPYWPYAPLHDVMHLDSGALNVNASLNFEQNRESGLRLSVNGQGELKDISLSDPDKGPILQWDSLDLVMREARPLDGRVHMASLKWNNPRLVMERKADGTFNLEKYVQPLLTKNKSKSGAKDASGPPILITAETMALRQGQIRYVDHTTAGSPVVREIVPINMEIRDFSTAPEKDFSWNLALATQDAETLHIQAATQLFPLTVKGQMQLVDLQPKIYMPLAKAQDTLQWHQGMVSMQTDFSFDQDKNMTVALENGEIIFRHCNATLPAANMHAELDSLKFHGISCTASDPHDRNLKAGLTNATLNGARLTQTDSSSHAPVWTVGVPQFFVQAVHWSQSPSDSPLAELGHASLSGLELNDSQGAQPVRLHSLDLENADFSPANRRAEIESLTISGLEVKTVRDAEKNIDLPTLLSPAEKNNTHQTANSTDDIGLEDKPWVVELENLLVQNTRCTLDDRSAPDQVITTLENIEIQGSGIRSDLREPARFQVRADLASGGSIAAQGRASMAPLKTSGEVIVDSFELMPFLGYAPADMALGLHSGRLSLNARWDLKEDDGLSGSVTGRAELNSLAVTVPKEKEPVLSCDRLAVEEISCRLNPNILEIQSIQLSAPRSRLNLRPDGRLDLIHYLDLEPEESEDKESEQVEPFFSKIILHGASLTSGRLAYRDQTVDPAFTLELQDIEIDLKDTDRQGDTPALLSAGAALSSGGRIKIDGRLDPLADPVFAELDLRLTDMNMPELSPYTKKYIAYPLSRGQLNWSGSIHTKDNALDSKNDLMIRSLELGEKVNTPDAPNVPIKLGLALLQDGKGDLSLQLPVSGRLDDPDFSVGAVVFKAVINLFTKIVAAPFSILGSIFGGGPDLNILFFDPGRSELSAEDKTKLDELAKALAQRPALRLDVTGMADPVRDGPALLDQAFARTVLEKFDNKDQGSVDLDEIMADNDLYEDILWEIYKGTPVDKPENFLGFPKRVPVEEMEKVVRRWLRPDRDDLLQLAEQRAMAARQYFLGHPEITTDRIFVTLPSLEPPADGDSAARVQMGLGR